MKISNCKEPWALGEEAILRVGSVKSIKKQYENAVGLFHT